MNISKRIKYLFNGIFKKFMWKQYYFELSKKRYFRRKGMMYGKTARI